MKNWIKKINENKFQFFFFIGILTFLFVSLIIIGATNNDPVDEPPVDDEPNTPVIPDKEEPTTTETVELVILPLDKNKDFEIVRKFYERNGTKEEQVFQCGTSSKDAGSKICSIIKVEKTDIYHSVMNKMLVQEDLIL